MALNINIKGLKNVRALLDPKKIARASRSAVNTTATATRKESFSEAEKVFNVKQSRLKKDSRGRRTTFIVRASRTRKDARIEYKAVGRPGLQHYRKDRSQTNKKKVGWKPTIRIKQSGSTTNLPRSFYGIGKLKGQGIFQRNTRNRKIVRRTGPSIRTIMADKGVITKILRKSKEFLSDNFRQKLREQWRKR